MTLLLSLAISLLAIGQDTQAPSLDSGTLNSQFDYIIKESNSYKDYKVIKNTWLNKIKSHVLDSVKVVRTELGETQELVDKQNKEIDDLKVELAEVNNNLATVNNEKNSINFFGVQTNKSTYKQIMWAIIAGLLGLLLFFIYRFTRSNIITKEARKSLVDTQNEFEVYKKRAREKEQKIMRDLQDERNKNHS